MLLVRMLSHSGWPCLNSEYSWLSGYQSKVNGCSSCCGLRAAGALDMGMCCTDIHAAMPPIFTELSWAVMAVMVIMHLTDVP